MFSTAPASRPVTTDSYSSFYDLENTQKKPPILPGTLLPLDRFSYWLNSILIVTFDIEVGQFLEAIYPSPQHVKLTQNEKANICYMSFPDSNSGFLGDTQHFFRIRQDPVNKLVQTGISSASHSIYDSYNEKSLPSLEVSWN